MTSEQYCEYVSSRGILKSCNIYSSTPISGINSLINYDFGKMIDGTLYNPTIYVCITAIPFFINNVFDKIPVKFILVTGDNDETCPYDILNKETFINFVESDKIIHWFSQNCMSHVHKKLTQIPIGLDYHTMANADHAWGKKLSSKDQELCLKNIKKSSKPFYERKVKAYSNFHFFMETKFGYDRKDAFKSIDKRLVYYEECKVERAVSWQKQSEYAFVISPHGNGLDCHRTWEALCLGCIPIVKTSILDPLYEELPVLIVKDWSQLNENILNETINLFKNKTFNYEKLTLTYWMNKINEYKTNDYNKNDYNKNEVSSASNSGSQVTDKIMKQYSVVICGCCRNVERYIERNLFIINEIGKRFFDYKVIIYENDSTDNTRQLLITCKNEKTEFIFENNVAISNRTERIAHCRNKILEIVNSKYLNYDYMLMLDLDDVLYQGNLQNTIHSCFLYKAEQWDAMFANCNTKYYDIYALRKKNYLMSCCWNNVNVLKQKGIPHNMAYNECIDKFIINYPANGKLIPVISAFGGAGLYKMSVIKGVKYIGVEPTHVDNQICEHVPFNTTLYNNGRKLYINPKMLIY